MRPGHRPRPEIGRCHCSCVSLLVSEARHGPRAPRLWRVPIRVALEWGKYMALGAGLPGSGLSSGWLGALPGLPAHFCTEWGEGGLLGEEGARAAPQWAWLWLAGGECQTGHPPQGMCGIEPALPVREAGLFSEPSRRGRSPRTHLSIGPFCRGRPRLAGPDQPLSHTLGCCQGVRWWHRPCQSPH